MSFDPSIHPRRLGKYEVAEVIGEGAMGVVYRATDTLIRRDVAIKILHRQLVGSGPAAEAILERFRNEARAAGRLLHPGIVALYEYGEDPLGPYLVMEMVEGESLKQHLRQRDRLEDAQIVTLMGQLLDALEHAHEQGVFHRDIKPSNLILTPRGRLKIADFGIARIDAPGVTLANTLVGTPGHMAPEQYTGERVDGRTDIFASGVLLYQLLTRRSPFGGSEANVMFETLHSEPTPPSRLPAGQARDGFDAVVARAMAKRPQDRYAYASEFRQALIEVRLQNVKQRGVAAPPAGDPGALPVPPPLAVAPPSVPAPGRPRGGSSGYGQLPLAALIGEAEIRTAAQLLAQHVGPIAKLLTTRAATRATSRDAFHALLADEVEDPSSRALLWQQLQALRPAKG